MGRKIKSILRTFQTCQTAKYPNQHTYVEIGDIVMNGKKELVCIDPLPRTTRGMEIWLYVLMLSRITVFSQVLFDPKLFHLI